MLVQRDGGELTEISVTASAGKSTSNLSTTSHLPPRILSLNSVTIGNSETKPDSTCRARAVSLLVKRKGQVEEKEKEERDLN